VRATKASSPTSSATSRAARYRDGALPHAELDPALVPDFDGLADEVSAFIDRAELTQALEVIWQRVRRLNRYVEEQAPWQLAKDDARAGDLDRVLRTLAEGLRVVTVLLSPCLPESSAKLLDALGAPDLSLAGATLEGGRVEQVTALEPLFPKPT
jgi:methionyl-tRNA synthetase